MPRRYTRAAVETGDYEYDPTPKPAASRRTASNPFTVEGFPDELLEGEERPIVVLPEQPSSGPLEYIPSVIKEDANGFEEEYDEDYDNTVAKEEQEPEVEEDEEEYTAPVTRRSSQRRSAAMIKNEEPAEEEEEEEEDEEVEETPKKAKKEKKEKNAEKEREKEEKKQEAREEKRVERERKRKERERRELDSKLEAELRAAHGGGSAKSKKKKPEKPAYVGGLPTAPIQVDPVVSNPYNYDPRMEMMKLGTGQLKSAYRKTRNNVELHIEKNLYKLEPKRGSHDGSESREQSLEPDQDSPYSHHDRYNSYQPQESHYDDYNDPRPPVKRSKYEPISVDTFETPSSSQRKDSRPSPYTPTSIASPSPSQHKPKLSSPSLYSHEPQKAERRLSDTSSAMKKGVYMPAMSRQDKMIAEAASASSSRHSSISSERRPSFIPDFNSSRHSSVDTPLYTPTLPQRSSWLPNTSNINRHSLDDDSPIDVVNDSMSPIDVLNSPNFPTAITPPPITLLELQRDFCNGKKKHELNDVKKKVPSKEAVAELKTLVGRLKAINDS